jgi:ribosomal protein S6--L-glutamate ligase
VKICLLVDRLGHPVLEAAARELAGRRDAAVSVVDVGRAQAPDDADVYLLKSRAARALTAAHRAELRGASVVNGAAATAACLDRACTALRMRHAHLPFPATWSAPTLDHLIGALSACEPVWPLFVKSRRSRRGDLVRLVSSHDELIELASDWRHEPVVAQRLVRHDGWEHKVWVIGGHIHAVRRRTEPGAHGNVADTRVPCEQLPAGVAELARATGSAFGLELYGIDVLFGERGPVVVDVNPFPGFRRVPLAGQAIAAQVLGRGRRRSACV